MSHSKRKTTTKGNSSSNASREQYASTSAQPALLRRIRTPHPHDVLCGRGGGINSHAGNVTFRQWVSERKNDYNLASNKVEKAQVATEVMDLVKRLRPPGRFLARDESTGSSGLVTWWVEIDASKAMAKTSQALREGAPSIRAKHTGVTPRKRRSGSSSSSGTKRRGSMDTMLPPPPIEASEVALATAFEAAQLQAAAQATTASLEEAPLLHPATLLTPKLAPTVTSSLPARTPELTSLPAPLHDSGSMVRSHSLALSDMSHHDFLQEDFVNPFEEENLNGGDNHHHAPVNNNNKRPRPSPPSSHGDMGGLGALFGGGGISSSSNSFNHVFTHHPLGSRGMTTKNSNNSSSGSNSGGTTSRSVSDEEKTAAALTTTTTATSLTPTTSTKCFCECGSALQEGKVCPCGSLADHLAWRDDAIGPQDWLNVMNPLVNSHSHESNHHHWNNHHHHNGLFDTPLSH